MLNILFWNLKRNKDIENYIVECIDENNVDIAIFSEFDGIDFTNIEKKLGTMYERIRAAQEDKKVTLMAKTTLSVTTLQQQNRYNLYNVKTALKDYVFAAVHLEDQRYYAYVDRIETIKHLVSDIEKTEDLLKCGNTVVIGDFNVNPYADELLSKHAFNAVLFKTIIEKKETIKINESEKKRFYNPILHYISEDTGMYGSFYYGSKSTTSYWHCLDQVIVRKNLVNNISHMQYLKKIKSESLLKNMIPNETISDHLPLFITFKEIEDGN